MKLPLGMRTSPLRLAIGCSYGCPGSQTVARPAGLVGRRFLSSFFARFARKTQPSDKELNALKKQAVTRLVTAAALHPLIDKAVYGGEDAFALGPNYMCVTDGVGGWQGIVDVGLFSRTLVRLIGTEVGRSHSWKEAVASALRQTWEMAGTVTFAGARLDPLTMKLSVAWVGDARCMVLRQGKVVFETEDDQVDFNFPVQIGHFPMKDRYDDMKTSVAKEVEHVRTTSFDVEPGDIVMCATDGVTDNLFNGQIEKLAQQHASNPAVLANEVAEAALSESQDPEATTPFVVEYQRHRGGLLELGGKEDDITITVGLVQVDPPRQK